jgi:tetratricopeptide (TPR) repeat protein
MNKTHLGFRIVIILLILLSAVAIFAQSLEEQLQREYEKKMSYKRTVYNKTLDFIYQNPESPGLAQLYFNLAEMSTEIDVSEPWKTTEYYQKVIQLDPDFFEKDVVYYNIGYYGFNSELTKRDEARMRNIDLVINWPDSLRLNEDELQFVIQAYKEVLENCPDSAYNTEAAYRLGMVYFNIALDARVAGLYFEKAIEYFDIVAGREGDPLQNHGLFQRGWTYFASTKYEEAIEDFTHILAIIHLDSLDTERPFFEADAIENMAFSLIEYDGTDFEQYSLAAAKAIEIFQTFISEEYGQDVILAAVELKKKYNAPMQAVDLYDAYLKLYPDSKISPCIVDSIMTIYKHYPSRTRGGVPAEDLVINEMERLVVHFRPDSIWYQTNKDKDISAELQVIKDAYEFMEPKFYNRFAQSKAEEDYLAYEELTNNYCKFSEFYDDLARDKKQTMRKNVVTFSQDMAEASKDPKFYFDSIVDIDNFIEANPEHPELYYYKDIQFYNYEQIYEILTPIIAEQVVYADSTRGILLDKDGLDSLYIGASEDFEIFLEDYAQQGHDVNEQIIKVIYDRAELRYEREELDEAYNDYYVLLNHDLTDELLKISYARLAEISQGKGNLDDAETFYREAANYASAEEQESLNNNVLATMQMKATTLTDSSDYVSGAEQYLKLARELETTKPDESTSYMFKAIENYEKAGEYQTAIDLYLQIASRKTQKEEVLAAYLGAWTISDSLQNWPQSENLRQQFIELYPSSNEAYKLQLQIIGFYEGEQFNDKRQAAQMLEILHDEAGQFDLGEDKPENLLLKALMIYQELNDEDKIIELCLKFERLYPNHEKSNDFLVQVARMYNDRNDEAKFEEMAAYIYKKDPTIDLLVQVAADKLKEIKAEADSLFAEKSFEEMQVVIDAFNDTEQYYRSQNVELPTEAIHETFQYYMDFVSFQNSYRDKFAEVRDGFLNADLNSLIKVNHLTEWKKHLIEGASRIPALMKRCDGIKDDMIALIQQGNQYELPTEARTEAIYLAGKVYDFGSEVVITQVQKYLDVSDQLNNDTMKQNPVQQQQYKTALKNNSLQLANEFRKKAAQMYQTCLATFYDGKDYSDKWTELALNRLVEWGVRKSKIYDEYFANESWEQNLMQIADLDAEQDDTTYWKAPEIITEARVFESANAFVVPGGENVYYKTQFEAEIKPELLSIEYAYDRPVQIFVNKVPVEKEPVLQDEFIDIMGTLVSHYKVSTTHNTMGGMNTIVFVIEQDAGMVDNSLFSVHITVQYDEETLEFYRSTDQFEMLTDFSWTAAMAPSAASTPSDISAGNWSTVGIANFQYFKKQMFGLENSEASEIWYARVDTNKVDTVFLKKELEIRGTVLNATAKYFAQNTASIWINDELVVDSQVMSEDEKLKKVLSNEFTVTQLIPGKNTIAVRVTGEEYYKGFIMELDYITTKTDDRPVEESTIEESTTEETMNEGTTEEVIEENTESTTEEPTEEVIEENTEESTGDVEEGTTEEVIEETTDAGEEVIDETVEETTEETPVEENTAEE